MRRTVVIVDDHARFRRSARTLLELEGFEVVGEAADGASALAEVERTRPDLALVDVGLPDMSGFEVAERVGSETRVVLVSSRHHDDVGRRVRSCGAAGFVPKDELAGETLAAVLDENPQ
jgi:DNA-binding NarL/FixJ family response regulator